MTGDLCQYLSASYMRSPQKAWIVCLLVVAVLALYAPLLNRSPIYLAHDEVLFALQAQAIATTGHDLKGRWLPLYFELFGGYWAQPFVVYLTALTLTVLPLSESSIRFPSVVVGVTDVVLMYVVAHRVFDERR